MFRSEKKILGIHGGGNIGLGLMAQIAAESPFDYHVMATSSNKLNNTLINSVNKLWLQHGAAADSAATCVQNVSMIGRDKNDLLKLYTESNLLAICLTPTVLAEVASDIAEALIARYKLNDHDLKIMVLMNIPNCAEYTYNKIREAMQAITPLAEEVLASIEFIPTVIDRVVLPIDQQTVQKQLRAQLLKHMDGKKADAILQSDSELANAVKKYNLEFRLFNAESNFMMYVPDTFAEAHHFPSVNVTSDLAKIDILKNKYFNGPHAVLAWMGGLLGCKTIAETIMRPSIQAFIKDMMENEIKPILAKEHPEITEKEFKEVEDSFFKRCLANKDDTVFRVGRDPLRKLNSGARIRGTIELAEKHNLNISTTKLEEAIAAGVLYAIKEVNPEDAECQRMLQIYKENNNSYAALLCHKSSDPSDTFNGFSVSKDKERVNEILSAIARFQHYKQHDVWRGLKPVNQDYARTSPMIRKQSQGGRYV